MYLQHVVRGRERKIASKHIWIVSGSWFKKNYGQLLIPLAMQQQINYNHSLITYIISLLHRISSGETHFYPAQFSSIINISQLTGIFFFWNHCSWISSFRRSQPNVAFLESENLNIKLFFIHYWQFLILNLINSCAQKYNSRVLSQSINTTHWKFRQLFNSLFPCCIDTDSTTEHGLFR